MSWAKLDDAILDNPKILSVGPIGFALHIAAICYCARNLTDGFVPLARAATLLDLSGVQIDCANPIALPVHGQRQSMAGDVISPDAVIDALLGAELWHGCDGGYRINDYLEYNPSKADVLAERERIRGIRSEAGKAGAASKLSKRQANGLANQSANGQQTSGPVPVPVPVPTKTSTPTVKSGENLEGYRPAADRLAGPSVLGRDGGRS